MSSYPIRHAVQDVVNKDFFGPLAIRAGGRELTCWRTW